MRKEREIIIDIYENGDESIPKVSSLSLIGKSLFKFTCILLCCFAFSLVIIHNQQHGCNQNESRTLNSATTEGHPAIVRHGKVIDPDEIKKQNEEDWKQALQEHDKLIDLERAAADQEDRRLKLEEKKLQKDRQDRQDKRDEEESARIRRTEEEHHQFIRSVEASIKRQEGCERRREIEEDTKDESTKQKVAKQKESRERGLRYAFAQQDARHRRECTDNNCICKNSAHYL